MEIVTERLLLRELEEGDAPACNAYESDPTVVRYQSHDVCTLEQSLAYIQRNQASIAEAPRRTFDLAVVLRDDGALVGRVGLQIGTADARQAELWYVLDPRHWGRGLIPEAARALVDFGFRELGLHRVAVDCDPRNAASARVAEKLGMRREAHLVENVWIKGEWCDSLIFGVLDREWRAATAPPAGPAPG